MATTRRRRGYVERLAARFDRGTRDALKIWKAGAKRPDRIGEVSYRTLELVHGGVGAAVRSLGRLEKATQPPARPAKAAHDHATHATHAAPHRATPGSGATTS